MRRRPPDRPGGPPPRSGGPGDAAGNDGSWRRILGAGSPKQILPGLVRGDPLGIVERCRRYASEQALLVEPARLAARTFARVAYAAALHGYHGKPVLDVWLAERITDSFGELQIDDAEQETQAIPPAPADQSYFSMIAELTEVEGDLARRLCLVFNQLPFRTRLPFFRVAVEGRSFEEAAVALDLPLDEVKQVVEETYLRIVRQAREMDDDIQRGLL